MSRDGLRVPSMTWPLAHLPEHLLYGIEQGHVLRAVDTQGLKQLTHVGLTQTLQGKRAAVERLRVLR